ncbi:MAG: PDZ domain-containing protein [Verrucomicrobiales bacterium]|nr:PDZ domain-containing protein [Verrucomicrobiales bacterium]
MRYLKWIGLLLILSGNFPLGAEAVKDREGAVRGDAAAMREDARWIYNDIEKGFAESKKTGKPLLVVLRCVPCLACMGMDAEVLKSAALQPLLDAFICVRVINANALDLTRFQFDYDLSFSTLFFEPDGTLLARFGSWKHQKDKEETSLASYRATLQKVLELHRAYPDNLPGLKGKQGRETRFATPVEIPALAAKYGRELDWQGEVVKSCVHCHQVGDALRADFRERGETIPLALIFPMPGMESLGVMLDAETASTVAEVRALSPASAAEWKAGDEIVELDGQVIASAADLAWVLHHAPEQGSLNATVNRDGGQIGLRLVLPPEWRYGTDISRRVGTWPMRAMALGGLKLESLSEEERQTLGELPGPLALRVAGLGKFGPHGAARKAGFQQGDILVSVAGIERDMGEGELIGRLLQAHPKPAQIEATVRRGNRNVTLKLPVQ